MAGNIWQPPAGAGANQIYLWAQRLSALFQQGKHKDYVTRAVTLSAGTSTVVAETSMTDTSRVLLTPTSSAAAAIHPYVSARTVGTGFTLTHSSAAGGETYDCIVIR